MLRITEPAFYLTTPDLISIYLEDSSSTVQVSNGRQTISLTGVFNPNDNIKIRISTDADKQSDIILNGESHLELLNLDSDFENFALKEMISLLFRHMLIYQLNLGGKSFEITTI